ncbi:MAG: V-type ATPase subunit [Acholeplasmataceae bacterium]|jgi:V/A-type H+-transporting ATPase subunit C
MPYTFASGAINAKSANLFGETQYLTLLKTDKSEYLKVLRDLGYGFDHVSYYLDEVITNEQIKTKTELLQIVPNLEIVRLWYLKYDLINIKLLLKNHFFIKSNDLTFEKQSVIPIYELKEALINQEFSKVSSENEELLRQLSEITHDKNLTSQSLSHKVDQIVYSYMLKKAQEYRELALIKYLQKLIDSNNLITLFRAENIHLTNEEFNNHLILGGEIELSIFKELYNLRIDEKLDILKLHYSDEVINVLQGFNELVNLSLLDHTLKQDLLKGIKDYNYDTFSSGPLINYLLAKEFEINNVRLLYFDKEVDITNLLKY